MNNPLYLEIKNSLNAGLWRDAFVEKMGWGTPPSSSIKTQTGNEIWSGEIVAQLKGFKILKIQVNELPDTHLLRAIDESLFKQFAERMTIVSSPTSTAWLWPRKRASGFLAPEIYEHSTSNLPDYIAQKLAAISFSVQEHSKGITLGQVRDKVRGQFDTSKVTKKFYEDFKKQHESLTKAIQGLPESDAHSYSSLLLNRLMFIYFLQKKEFINGDPNYLRNCLTKLQALNTDVKFYSFYKHLLRELFYEGLNKQNHEFSDPKIAEILGEVPYVNGGIFEANELEQASEIEIPDSAFEDIFRLFDSYRWHLDTSPTGNPNEINPEVIGYIFEQYINYTSSGRREKGAYYTPKDVCGFMAKNTIIPFIADKLESQSSELYSELSNHPEKFINQELMHGWDFALDSWIPVSQSVEQIWLSDPIEWSALDSQDPDPEICIHGESWIEALHRRERVNSLRISLKEKSILSANDLISQPIDSVKIIVDFAQSRASLKDLRVLWMNLNRMRVIDPTCGSGAFLFSALEILEDIYFATIAGFLRFDKSSEVLDQLESYGFEESLSRRRYIVRKQIARQNLYGTDLMGDAIETAKLRLFLSLVACLETKDDLEPLPDLDFNFKCANLVVGFYDESDADRVSENMWAQSSLKDLGSKIEDYRRLHRDFMAATVKKDYEIAASLKSQLLSASHSLRTKANEIYADCTDIDLRDLDEWAKEHRPFHWFVEFPEVLENGGFDIVIGNPPYISGKNWGPKEKKLAVGYKTIDCPDFYAVCFERSLQLMNSEARHAMIVMVNLAFSDDFDPLRSFISECKKSEWWSTYGKRPDSLFEGIDVVNTILILGPGGQKWATNHQLFTTKSRSYLFSNLHFQRITREATTPPLRGGVANNILKKIIDSRRTSSASSGEQIYSTRSARYWYSVLPSPVPILDNVGNPLPTKNDSNKAIKLRESENAELALSLLGGKLGYLFWSSTGDDFNSSSKFGEKVLGLLSEVRNNDTLSELAKDVLKESRKQYFKSPNAGKYYINIRWSALRGKTDLFDRQVLSLLGMESEWRSLNIWYRQVMKSSGNNTNGQDLDYSEFERLVNWYKSNVLT